MGVYVYCNKPSHIALAEVELADGTRKTAEVALYRYAYKPTHSWDGEKLNQRWRFSSGAASCASAWARSNKVMPLVGTFFNADAGEVYAAGRSDANGLFTTGGSAEVYDDCTDNAGKVVRWVRLPKGITEGEMPAPEMHERLTPSMVLQVKRGGERGAQWPAFRARLADEATGETMPGWWLFSTAEQLEQHALKLGVLAKAAPEGAL
jgi:hypothetical protein